MADQSLTNDCPECGASLEVSGFMPFEKVACPACRAQFRVRVVFDHYQIEEMRGIGGMSQVFVALDTNLNRRVALKVLNRENSSKEDRIVQFEREARLTASISHPNVVRVYGVGHAQGNFYIAMELVEGASLEEILREEEKLSESQVLDLAIQTTEGLAAAHRVGLIHRDIKPGNILLTAESRAKLVDFGLALVFEKDVDDSNEMWATPYYVPPEKLAGGVEDFRSDIYSLGSTFFHLLAGRPPYESHTASIEELKAIKSHPVRLGAFAPMVSGPTQEVVNRMIELRPQERYQSYADLLEALRTAKQNLLGSLGSIKQVSRTSRRQEQRRKQMVQLLAAGLILALAAVGSVVWHALSGKTGDAPLPGTEGDGVSGEGWSVSTVESDNVGERFVKARQMLAEGKFKEARAEFLEIFDSKLTRQPTSNWAAYSAALADLLAGEPGQAREVIRRMISSPEFMQGRVGQAGPFFRRVGDHLLAPWPLPANQLEDMKKNRGWEAEALVIGLKNWEHGRFKDAAVYIEAVRSSKPSQDLAWISGLHGLLGKYTLDAGMLARLDLTDDFPRSRDTESAIRETREALGKLQTEGRMKRFIEARLANLEKTRDTLLAKEKQQEAESLARRTAKELGDLETLVARLPSFRAGYRFEEAMVELNAFTPTTADGKARHASLVWIWQGPVDFLTTLVADLNAKSYRGNFQAREGAILYSDVTISKATRAMFVITGRIGIVNAPVSQVPPAQLTSLAVSMLEKTAGDAEVNKRRDLLARFNFHCGTTEAANRWATTLAEDKEFTSRWKAAMAGEPPHLP